jgi:DNA-binding GntR family transcriptional regulator
LYVILAKAGFPVARASARLLPTVASAKLATLLEVKRGTPLLHIDQVDYDGPAVREASPTGHENVLLRLSAA